MRKPWSFVEEAMKREIAGAERVMAKYTNVDLTGFVASCRGTLLWPAVLNVVAAGSEGYDIVLNEVREKLKRNVNKVDLVFCLTELRRNGWIQTGDFFINNKGLTVFLSLTDSGRKALAELRAGRTPELRVVRIPKELN